MGLPSKHPLRARRSVIATAAALALVGALAGAAPASGEPHAAAIEVQHLERATADLGRAKRAVGGAVARHRKERAGLLSACTKRGPGWAKIRAVGHAPQRALYTRAARVLLRDMRALLLDDQALIAAYSGPFDRFLESVRRAGVNTPLLQEAIAAHARRKAYYQSLGQIGVGCRVFNALTRRVREFPTRSAAQIIRADYKASPIARRIERYVSSRILSAQRRSGVTDRDARTLEQAAGAMVDLGGNAGYANGFRYAMSLR